VAARPLAGALLAAAAAGCGGPRTPPPVVDAPDGISIAVYVGVGRGYAVVDDRRTIEVAGRRVLLDRIDRGAALSTLVIEPLGAARGKLAIEHCAREQLRPDPADPKAAAGVGAGGVASPLVACTVTGAPGRHRVRVHHVAASYGFQTRHEIAMAAPDRATISTRFAVPVPAFRARGEVVLHEGVPGAGDPPREVGRGTVTLDGGVAVIALPPREVPARLVRVYDGMLRATSVEQTDPAWGKDSHHAVRVVLELDDAGLLRGPAHVRITSGADTYEIGTAYAPDDPAGAPERLPEGRMGRSAVEVRAAEARAAAAAARARAAPATGPVRLPLWIDPLLRGVRRRSLDRTDGASHADRLDLTVSNTGGQPREVWIEEPLRPARRREIVRAKGIRPELAGDVARAKVVIGPGQIERLAFTVRYTF
jgi:hypothetical protein